MSATTYHIPVNPDFVTTRDEVVATFANERRPDVPITVRTVTYTDRTEFVVFVGGWRVRTHVYKTKAGADRRVAQAVKELGGTYA